MARKELNEVHLLRGLASLMVCLFHLILGNANLFPSSNLLERTFSFGYLGVEIFFILSGYVICYSFPEGFGFRHLGTFFSKRIVRIEPPYIASIVLVIVLNLFSHKITGIKTEISYLNVLSHLAYINNFNPTTYLNVVYWTLGVEFQFYLLIAFVFPFMKVSRYILLLILGIFMFLSCLHFSDKIAIILPYLSYFALGILLYFYKLKRQVNSLLFLFLSVLFTTQIFFFQGVEGTVAAVFTVLVLLFWQYSNSIIRFFSTISYSLYLIHVPVGGKVINLGMRFATSPLSRYSLVLVAVLVSVGFAYLFHKIVEQPAFKLSKKIVYKFPNTRSVESGSNKEDRNFQKQILTVPSSNNF